MLLSKILLGHLCYGISGLLLCGQPSVLCVSLGSLTLGISQAKAHVVSLLKEKILQNPTASSPTANIGVMILQHCWLVIIVATRGYNNYM